MWLEGGQSYLTQVLSTPYGTSTRITQRNLKIYPRNSLLGSCSHSCGDLLMLEGNTKDVFMVIASILHRFNEFASLFTRHRSCLFKDALKGSADICRHGDITTHVKVATFFDELVDYFVCIFLEQVLNVGLW